MWWWWWWCANCLLYLLAILFLSGGWLPPYASFFSFAHGDQVQFLGDFSGIVQGAWEGSEPPTPTLTKQWASRAGCQPLHRLQQKTPWLPGLLDWLQGMMPFLPLTGRKGLSSPEELAGEKLKRDQGEQIYSLVPLLAPSKKDHSGLSVPRISRALQCWAQALAWPGKASIQHHPSDRNTGRVWISLVPSQLCKTASGGGLVVMFQHGISSASLGEHLEDKDSRAFILDLLKQNFS